MTEISIEHGINSKEMHWKNSGNDRERNKREKT